MLRSQNVNALRRTKLLDGTQADDGNVLPFRDLRVRVGFGSFAVHHIQHVWTRHVRLLVQPRDMILVLEPDLELRAAELPSPTHGMGAPVVPFLVLPLFLGDLSLEQQPTVELLHDLVHRVVSRVPRFPDCAPDPQTVRQRPRDDRSLHVASLEQEPRLTRQTKRSGCEELPYSFGHLVAHAILDQTHVPVLVDARNRPEWKVMEVRRCLWDLGDRAPGVVSIDRGNPEPTRGGNGASSVGAAKFDGDDCSNLHVHVLLKQSD